MLIAMIRMYVRVRGGCRVWIVRVVMARQAPRSGTGVKAAEALDTLTRRGRQTGCTDMTAPPRCVAVREERIGSGAH
ncbi:hypothetical protein BV20DRAFT_975775 [Pilatotrama ljubarskyi]|nr:hypothetical protein BV20DRAFT_975775 [Pilatotrama ljubarskyi]